jgi:hypothetical protein
MMLEPVTRINVEAEQNEQGISEIDITTPDNPVIRYRFEEDLERGEVDSRHYDSVNLKRVPR